MQTVTLLKKDFKKEESRNIDREIALEKKIKQLDNIVYKRDQSAQTLKPKLYDGNVIKNTSAIVISDSEETLMLAEENLSPSCRPTKVEVLKELPKVSMHSKLNANSELLCVKCNGCMLSDNHDFRVIEFIKDKVDISHEASVARSPQQNGVVERRNHTLIEAARIMLIYAKALLFLWAEAVATACYTQNHSIIRLRHGKTSYELLHDKLPDLSFFHDGPSEHNSLEPAIHEMTPITISLGLVPNPPPSTPFVPPSRTDWDLLFQPLFDELLNPPSSVDRPAPEVIASIAKVVAPEPATLTRSPSSTTIDQDAPSPSNSQTTPETQSLIISNDVEEENHDLDVTHMNNDPFFCILIPENNSEASSSSDVIPTIVHTAAPNSEHVTK
ncbi:retrovirus-related pol polyprotein from transposon TNT 1-94 [Tanacetum coccineum]